MHIGFDADQNCSHVAPAAQAKGVSWIGRYLKNLYLPEVQAISAAGLKIVSIYESTAERALGGAPGGAADGARALLQAKELGQTRGSALYATADFDATLAQERDVLSYCVGFRAQLAGAYKFGIYGSGAICQAALDAGIVDYTWLAGGMGMRGSRAFHDAALATIEQDVGDERNLDLGIGIDSDIALADDYGGWSLSIAAPSPAPQRVLRLTSPPMTGADVGHLQARLAALGFDPGPADGVFGQHTEAAVLAFQAARGLTQDGIAGPQVWAAVA